MGQETIGDLLFWQSSHLLFPAIIFLLRCVSGFLPSWNRNRHITFPQKHPPKTNRHTIEKGKTCGIASHHTHHKKEEEEEEQQQQQTSCVGRMAGRSVQSTEKGGSIPGRRQCCCVCIANTHNHNNSIQANLIHHTQDGPQTTASKATPHHTVTHMTTTPRFRPSVKGVGALRRDDEKEKMRMKNQNKNNK